ncbi:hypothetical protein C1645_812118 [Glomus cerebriforme]|uniref:F-box domain-containing protein n=1 Tax=Glomus cerebriforme TaxID=658196 RepID=A0A397TQS4_9GLOM|nr:hypothetical protein C1645_812118 [Glomus cerebriforme]
MSKLNKDILFLLFEELQNDSKSLYSCLTVNRLWCETVIPILWKNPWDYSINYKNKNSLYYIITSYLTDDIKEFLTEQRIYIPSISRQSLLFDYLSFCKSFNVNIINEIISIRHSSDYEQFLLQQEIYIIIMKECLELKYLNMISIKHQIFYFPDAKVCLDSLCELKCDTSTNISYFYGLACICQNIQRLIIINTNSRTNHEIVKLIDNQKNLKYFEWKDEFKEDCFVDPYEMIFPALIKKADTLNHLIIVFEYFEYEHEFLLKILSELHNLKTLKIDDLELINEERLKTLIYRDLEILKIDYIKISTAVCMIKNSGGYLKEILLKYYYYLDEDNFNQDSLNLIRTIYENCPLIEYLSLVFSSSKVHFIELEILLKSCKNLKSLLLIMNCFNDENFLKSNEEKFSDGDELLKILISSAPNYLKEIRFFDHFKFSLESLETFFINWKNRPAISILTSDHIYDGENYLNLIKKYKNNGVIKDFNRVFKIDIYF